MVQSLVPTQTTFFQFIARIFVCVMVVIHLPPINDAFAQQPTPLDRAHIAGGLARFGPTFFRGIAAEYPGGVKSDALTSLPDQLNADLDNFAQKYKTQFAAAQSALNVATPNFSIVTPGFAMNAGPAVVPSTMLGAAANLSQMQVAVAIRNGSQDRAATPLKRKFKCHSI